MATRYVDSRVAGAGSGSLADPYKSTSSITPADGDVIALAAGATFREQIATAAIAANNLRITRYGTGADPIVRGSEIVSSWSATAYSGVFSTTLGSNVGGNVSENNVAMTCVFFTTNIATTAPLIPAGGFSFDTATYTLYIRPAGGSVTGNTYEVSQRLYGVYGTASFSGLEIDSIDFRGISRHGVSLLNRPGTRVHHCSFKVIGGYNTGTPVGNGVEIGAASNGSRADHNVFEDIFDSPVTFQLYSNSTSFSGGEVDNNTVTRCGFYGVEIGIVGAVTNCTLTNIRVHHNRIELAGYSWRPTDVTGRGIAVSGNQATSTISDIYVYANQLVNCRWGLSEDTLGATTARIKFYGNTVTTDRTPANGRGIFLSGDSLFESCLIVGYTYGIVSYGSTGATNKQVRNCTFVNVVNGIGEDGSAGTVTLRNNFFWHTGQWALYIGGTPTRDYQYNAIRASGGSVTSGMTLNANNPRPATYPLGSDYRPLVGSSLMGAGTHISYGRDIEGKQRQNPPSIGAYDVATFRRVLTTDPAA